MLMPTVIWGSFSRKWVIDLEPTSHSAHYDLGNIFHAKGDRSGAKLKYQEAMSSTQASNKPIAILDSFSVPWAILLGPSS